MPAPVSKEYKTPKNIGDVGVKVNEVKRVPASEASQAGSALAQSLLASQPARFDGYNVAAAAAPLSLKERMFGDTSTLGATWADIKGGAAAFKGDQITFGDKVDSVVEGTKMGTTQVAKGLWSIPTSLIPRATASALMLVGDALNRTQPNDIQELIARETGAPYDPTKIDLARNKFGKNLAEQARLMLDGLDIADRERLEKAGIDTNSQSIASSFGYHFGSGVGTLATAAGAAYFTGGTAGPALLLGSMEGLPMYSEARDKLIESGMSQEEAEYKAGQLTFITTGGIAMLEKVGLDMLWKSLPGKSNAYLMGRAAITETTQEMSQTIWQNGVQKYGYDETKGLFDDVGQTMLVTPLVGMFGAAGAGPIQQKITAAQDVSQLSMEQRIGNLTKSPDSVTLYRGQTEDSGGIHFTDNLTWAQGFGGQQNEVVVGQLKADAQIKTLTESDLALAQQMGMTSDAEIAQHYFDMGYDAVLGYDARNAQELDVMVNPASQEGFSVPVEIGNPDPNQVTIENAGKLPDEEKAAIVDELDKKYPHDRAEIEEIVNNAEKARQELVQQVRQGTFGTTEEGIASGLQQDILLSIEERGIDATVDAFIANQDIPVSDRQAAVEIIEAAVSNNQQDDVMAAIAEAQAEVAANTKRIADEATKTAEKADQEKAAKAAVSEVSVKNELKSNKELAKVVKEAGKNEANALSYIETQINSIIPGANTVRVAELAGEVLDVVLNPKFAPVIKTLPLNEVIRQVDATSSRFQMIDDVSRGTRGKAKPENMRKDDLALVLQFLNQLRSGATISNRLETDMRRQAERFGIDPDMSLKNIAKRLEMQILRSERLSKLADEITEEVATMQKKADANAKRRAEQREAKQQKRRIPDEMKKQIESIPLLKEIEVKMVPDITTLAGRKAFGRFYKNLIEFVDYAHVTTIPHESFHAFSQLALTKEEQSEMYKEARRIYERPLASDFEIEETLAQDFADWFVAEQQPKTFTEKLIEIFKKLKAALLDFVKPDNRVVIEDIFRDVISENAAMRVRHAMTRKVTPSDMRALIEAFYQDPEGFTLKLFNHDIFKKKTVGFQEVKQAIKQMGLKKGEIGLHEAVLEQERFRDQKKFDSQEYQNAVKSEMIQFRLVESGTYADYGLENIESDTQDPESDSYIDSYTHILDTNFEHGKAGHFGDDSIKGLHSHFRGGIRRGEAAFKMLELQSDVYQRGVPEVTEETIRAERQKAFSDIYEEVDKIRTSGYNGGQSGIYQMEQELLRWYSRMESAGMDMTAVEKPENLTKVEQIGEFLDAFGVSLEKQESRIVYSELSNEEKAQIAVSKQFAAMKNSWYELTIRTAIKEAAKRGATYFDMADTRTLAAVEGYIGEGGQLTEARGQNGNGVQPRDAEVGDFVGYLDSYDGLVVETMHDDHSLVFVYNPEDGEGVIQTAREVDLANEERERHSYVEEFSSHFWMELRDTFFSTTDTVGLSEDQIKEVAKAAYKTTDDITPEEVSNKIDGMTPNELYQFVGDNYEEMWRQSIEGSGAVQEAAETYQEELLDKFEEEFDGEEYFNDIYGSNIAVRYYDGNNWNVAWVTEGSLERVQASYGGVDAENFDLNDLNETQAGIAAKYGENDGKAGDYYKYLKKIRPDLELVEDDAGFSWWRTEITQDDMADVPLYQEQSVPEDRESSKFKDLADSLENTLWQIESAIAMSETGLRPKDDGGYVRFTTFPDWIPTEYRDKKLMESVFDKLVKGEQPRGVRQEALLEIMQEHLLNSLPIELRNEYVLNQYFQEELEVADALRAETLAAMMTMVKNLSKNPSTLKKGDVKKVIRKATGQVRPEVREFSRRMKERALIFNRGYKTGYKQGSKDKLYAMLAAQRLKRARTDRKEQLKKIYKRVKQASRTGGILSIEYQERLKDIFDTFDLTTMTDKTRGALTRMQEYFGNQEGDVPKDIAKKLERLDKIPLGRLSDDAVEQILDEVTRIFENGVTKKKLMDSRDERAFEAKVRRVVESTKDFSNDDMSGTIKRGSLKFYDPTRFSDIMDGAQDYSGANFKELVEPIRQSIDRANILADATLVEAFEEIASYGDTFTDEEMARIMFTSALEQGAEKQAETLAAHYQEKEGWDFVSALTEKERGALETMKRVFKEIRPGVAGTFEQIKNIPFPDIQHYFPLRYDRDIELFDIEDNAFEFSVTKTPQGFTINRIPQVGKVLDINIFKTFAYQVTAQTYYAEVQVPLENTRAVLNSPAYQKKMNRQTQDYWKQFIEDVATRGNGSKDFVGKQWMDTVRGNVSAAILGYKLSTVAIQPSALFDAQIALRQEFGAKAAIEVLPNFMKMMFSPAALQSAMDTSAALTNRQGGTIEIQEMKNATRGIFADSWWRKGWSAFKANAFKGIQFTDIRTAASVYDTFFKNYLRQGLSPEAATARAEQMMMLSQASANVASRPQLLNNSVNKFLLPFSSFIINAFNNIRYDGVMREMKKHGNVRGTLYAINNMQFLAYAVAYEAILYSAFSSLWGYDDDDEPFYKKMYASAVGRIPGIGFFFNFSGEFDGMRVNNPGLEALNTVLVNAKKITEDGGTPKEWYRVMKSVMVGIGIPGTQQLHQILTAPDIAGIGSIGLNLNIAYDDRNQAEKRADVVQPYLESKTGEITEEDVNMLLEELFGKEFSTQDVAYQTKKRKEMIEELAYRQEYGFEDSIVEAELEKASNGGNVYVKRMFLLEYGYGDDAKVRVSEYSRTLKLLGEQTTLLSDQLENELKSIVGAPEEWQPKINTLMEPDLTDALRIEIIDGDLQFAKNAYKSYGLISKELYESLTK